MLGKIKAAAQAVADLGNDTLAAAFTTLKGPLDELSAASGDLEQLGYRLREIELVCTLLPRIVVYLTREFAAREEAFQAVLANHANHRTVRTVVGLLQQTDRLLGKMELTGRRCTALAIELGVPPSVRLIYTAGEQQRETAEGTEKGPDEAIDKELAS